MLTAESRPRTLSWLHAGPLLFGDWGTSRLYVLGLAFYYTGHASLLYLVVMSVIMAGVAWAYSVVCRCFPEGGGVYSAARQVNPTLSVVGGTLLLCDFIVTAALSAVEGFHYLGAPHHLVVPLVMATLVALGVLNWLGARVAGRFALLIAVMAIGASAVIGLLCIPLLDDGLRAATTTVPGVESPWARWESLVRIVLALSGVEAVANMTGLMKQPVEKTAKKTIWPVLIEVVVLNLVFAVALNAIQNPGHAARGPLTPDVVAVPAGEHGPPVERVMEPTAPATPDYAHYEVHNKVPSEDVPADVKQYRDTAVKLLATHTASHAMGEAAGRWFGIGSGWVFGFLLLSATNTAIMAMVSVMYALARDKELPASLSRLNYSGVPWIGLIISCVLPAAVLLITSDVKALGELYAIGVVGAIAINLFSCAWNRQLPIKRWERWGMWGLAGLMVAVEVTIVVAKPQATIFAGVVLVSVLGSRFLLRQFKPPVQVVHVPQEGWLAQLRQTPPKVPTGGAADHGRRPRPREHRLRGGAGQAAQGRALCDLRAGAAGAGRAARADPADRGRPAGPSGAGARGHALPPVGRALLPDLHYSHRHLGRDPGLHGDLRVRRADHGQEPPRVLLADPRGRRGCPDCQAPARGRLAHHESGRSNHRGGGRTGAGQGGR